MTHTLSDAVLPSSTRENPAGARGGRPTPSPGLPPGLPPPHAGEATMRGLRLVAVWVGLALGAWAAVAGLGYGLYALVQALLG